MNNPKTGHPEKILAALQAWRPIGRSIAIRWGLHAEDAEDIVQDVALRVWRYLQRGHFIERPGAFFSRCVNNRLHSLRREPAWLSVLEQDVLDPTSAAAHEIEEREHRKWLLRNVAAVASPQERHCLHLLTQAEGDQKTAASLLLQEEGVSAPSMREFDQAFTWVRTTLFRLGTRSRSICPSQ